MQLTIWHLFAITLWCVSATVLEPESARQLYEEFKREYKKSYANDDDEYRFTIFKDNLARAKRLQAMEEGTAEYGITQFSDLSASEFESQYLGLNMGSPIEIDESAPNEHVPVNEDRFDWREHGAVGPVLDQGRCGSCWAFSTIGNIEGQWFLKKGKLLQLSEQQLLDCEHEDHGCSGGYPPQTYGEIQKMGGLELSSDYPYKAREGMCKMDRSKIKAYVNGSKVLPTSESFQAQQLKEIGPLASALNANILQFYRKGIIHPWKFLCNPKGLNHAVLTVGYGTEKGIPFWTVKNSWSKSFGEDGYFRIHRGDGTCGINLVVSTAIVK